MNSTHEIEKCTDIAKLRGIKFGGLNIRSLYKKIDDVNLLLQDSKLDFLGITESWLNYSIAGPEIKIPNYSAFRFDRDAGSGKRGGGGIVCYCSNRYNFEHLTDWNICTPDIGCRWSKLHLKATRPTFVGCIYRPPEGNIENFIDIIENKIIDIYDQGIADILLLGDLNIDF